MSGSVGRWDWSEFKLSNDQIAKFESLSITNEWDTLAICTALILLKLWSFDPDIRLTSLLPRAETITDQAPEINAFLDTFTEVDDLPCRSAYIKLIKEHPELNSGEIEHLRKILFDARDIQHSLTLPGYQETVLGSDAFENNYGIPSQLAIESYLTQYDQPVLTPKKQRLFFDWLSKPENTAGIMTNRPSGAPPGYLSSPEAELGAQRVRMNQLPLLGSGMLAWFAVTQCQLPEHTFLKPNPVHALALMQMCVGEERTHALQLAYDLWGNEGIRGDWARLENAKVIIFEDSVNGFEAVQAARALLKSVNIEIETEFVGVSHNPIKKQKLSGFSDRVYESLNQVVWEEL